jgi:hypothetical protein
LYPQNGGRGEGVTGISAVRGFIPETGKAAAKVFRGKDAGKISFDAAAAEKLNIGFR